MSDPLTSLVLQETDPQSLVGLFAFTTVFVTLFALGASLRPLRVIEETLPAKPLVLTLAAALVGVPLATLAISAVTGLRESALAGILLVGISPGAPLALRRSRGAGATSGYPAVLQVCAALLAVVAVPLWILVLDWMYGAQVGISLVELARQVFLSQILPLACGAVLALRAPALAARLAGPLMRLGTILQLALAAALVLTTWRSLAGVPWPALASSVCVAMSAVALGHVAGGPARETRLAGAVVCSLRNPGIALMISSANALPPMVKAVILAHVLVTALVLTAYLAFMRRTARSAEGRGDAPVAP